MLKTILLIAVNAVLIENFVLVRFLGICPFLGVSKKISTAVGMGLAVTFVMALASAITWAVHEYLLIPFDMIYMQTIVFILVIASLVQFVEMVIQKTSPSLYTALGIYLPLITTNCAVLGATLFNVNTYEYNLLNSVLFGTFAAVGFTLAIILLAGVRERLESSNIPRWLQGFPIVLISASIISIAFLGFQGLNFNF